MGFFGPDAPFWRTVDDRWRQFFAREGLRLVQAQVVDVGVDENAGKVKVRDPDGGFARDLYYPQLTPGYVPVADEWMWALAKEGGLLLLSPAGGGGVATRSLVLYNGASPLVANQDETGEYPITDDGYISRIVARVATAPVTTGITVSIKKNGVQIHSAVISAGQKSMSYIDLNLAVVDGDYITMVPTTVGAAGSPGAKLTVLCEQVVE